jgi:hypothetical protein
MNIVALFIVTTLTRHNAILVLGPNYGPNSRRPQTTMQYPTIGPNNGSNFIGLTYTMSFPNVGPNIGPNFSKPNSSPNSIRPFPQGLQILYSLAIFERLVTLVVSSPLERFEKLVSLPILSTNITQPNQEVKWSHDFHNQEFELRNKRMKGHAYEIVVENRLTKRFEAPCGRSECQRVDRWGL